MTTLGNTILVLSFIAAVVIWVAYNWNRPVKSE